LIERRDDIGKRKALLAEGYFREINISIGTII
jgi:hypothetical protein